MMNNEMMLWQARQDFIDMHKDILAGKKVSLAHYDQVAGELRSLDELNFTLMLEFVEKTDVTNIGLMWQTISARINQIKKSGQWTLRKDEQITWPLV